jgi:hypothetical protein
MHLLDDTGAHLPQLLRLARVRYARDTLIYELRSYVLASGRVGDYLAAVDEVGRPIRGDDYGKLEGHWVTKTGPADGIVTLWSYASLADRERLREELAKNERWSAEFLSRLPDLLLVQDTQIMRAVRPLAAPKGDNVYELRTDRTLVGKSPLLVTSLLAAAPVRERHAQNVGIWETTIGRLHQVVQLWAHPAKGDLETAVAALESDPEWQRFVKATAPVIAESHVQLLAPSPMSPMH